MAKKPKAKAVKPAEFHEPFLAPVEAVATPAVPPAPIEAKPDTAGHEVRITKHSELNGAMRRIEAMSAIETKSLEIAGRKVLQRHFYERIDNDGAIFGYLLWLD